MNNEFDPNQSTETAFENWLRVDEVPARPPAAFRQRLAESIEGANAKPQAGKRSWWVMAYAAAALAMVLGLNSFIQSNNTPAETGWMTVELELYSMLLDPIDNETLSELTDLLAYY